jgi:uncharacterized protein DUF4232
MDTTMAAAHPRRPRRPRRRTVALAGAAALAAGSLAITGGTALAGPATATGAAGSPPTCSTSELSGQVLPGSPGAGQRYATLVLTNTGTRTCAVTGYGGMALLGAPREGVPTDLHRVPGLPVHPVVLAPGSSARSLLHWTAVPAEDENGTSCEPVAPTVAITPPDQTSALLVPWRLGAVCQHGAIDQDPYVPGSAAF